MKKNQLLTLAIAFGLFLSSCGSLSVSKMRYTKGLNIGVFAAKDAKPEEIKAKKAEKKQVESSITKVNETTPKQENIAVVEVVKTEPSELNQATSDAAANSSSKTISNVNNHFSKKEIKKAIKNIAKTDVVNMANKVEEITNKPMDTNESDTPTILLVILCLFPILALVAIYLHQGEINSKFWIDLILHFLLLYWLYALLVVLDVL